jgi:hypothetical protein
MTRSQTVNLHQSNLTFDERERLAFITGQALPHDEDHYDDVSEALEFRDVATDWASISTPDDLRKEMETLNDLYAALPEGVSDADELRAWASTAEDITKERDELRESLAAISLVLKKKKGQMTKAQIKELIDWIDYATNDSGAIDEQRLADDLDVTL